MYTRNFIPATCKPLSCLQGGPLSRLIHLNSTYRHAADIRFHTLSTVALITATRMIIISSATYYVTTD